VKDKGKDERNAPSKTSRDVATAYTYSSGALLLFREKVKGP